MTSSRDDLTAALAAFDAAHEAFMATPNCTDEELHAITALPPLKDAVIEAARALLAEDPLDRPPTAGEVLSAWEADGTVVNQVDHVVAPTKAMRAHLATYDPDTRLPGWRLVPGDPEPEERPS